MAEQPPPDSGRLLTFWKEWEAGDELPGRALANLKTAGLPNILEATIAADGSQVASALLTEWSAWEKGRAGPPAELLARLRDAGLGEFLASTAAAQAEAFGEE